MTDSNGKVWFEKNAKGKHELHGKGIVVTDENCTNCRKTFRMRVNFDVNGNHIMVCPHCGHHHCRTIKDGVVTGDRWDSRNTLLDVVPEGSFWKSTTIGAETTTAFNHIRQAWLGRLKKPRPDPVVRPEGQKGS